MNFMTPQILTQQVAVQKRSSSRRSFLASIPVCLGILMTVNISHAMLPIGAYKGTLVQATQNPPAEKIQDFHAKDLNPRVSGVSEDRVFDCGLVISEIKFDGPKSPITERIFVQVEMGEFKGQFVLSHPVNIEANGAIVVDHSQLKGFVVAPPTKDAARTFALVLENKKTASGEAPDAYNIILNARTGKDVTVGIQRCGDLVPATP